MVQAMEAALNDIMDDKPQADDARSAFFESPDPSLKSPHELDSSRSFMESLALGLHMEIKSGKTKSSIFRSGEHVNSRWCFLRR
jgi:hypothetical protein